MDKILTVIKENCPQNHPCPAVQACPVGALTQNLYNAPDVDHDRCIRCGKCAKICPKKALSID